MEYIPSIAEVFQYIPCSNIFLVYSIFGSGPPRVRLCLKAHKDPWGYPPILGFRRTVFKVLLYDNCRYLNISKYLNINTTYIAYCPRIEQPTVSPFAHLASADGLWRGHSDGAGAGQGRREGVGVRPEWSESLAGGK